MSNTDYEPLLLLTLQLFLIIRGVFSYYCSIRAINKINTYCLRLIETGSYNLGLNYYLEMKYSYASFFFSFWIWDKNKIIKKEYRDML